MDMNIDYEERILREDLISLYLQFLEAKGQDVTLVRNQFDDLKKSLERLVKDDRINVKGFYDAMVDLFNNPSDWERNMKDLTDLNRSCEVLLNSVLSYSTLFGTEPIALFKTTAYSLILFNVIANSLIINYT